ncbi:MAG: hypothetical protein RhofKO_14030 [Rhodothermales bacterium]
MHRLFGFGIGDPPAEGGELGIAGQGTQEAQHEKRWETDMPTEPRSAGLDWTNAVPPPFMFAAMSQRRLFVVIAFGILLAFVLLDTSGIFDDSPYLEIPHGNHVHYVPKDCGSDIDINRYPTAMAPAGQRIDCFGQYVPE